MVKEANILDDDVSRQMHAVFSKLNSQRTGRSVLCYRFWSHWYEYGINSVSYENSAPIFPCLLRSSDTIRLYMVLFISAISSVSFQEDKTTAARALEEEQEAANNGKQ